MRKTLALALMLGAVFAAPSFADVISPKIELTLGAFRNVNPEGEDKEINVEVTNGTDKVLRFVSVRCGFYNASNVLVRTGISMLVSIMPGETVPTSVSASNTPDAVRAACRVDYVSRQ